jgi:hypothetical protein
MSVLKSKKQSSFRGKVASNAQKTTNTGASYGHLRLPKGVSVFNPEADGRYKLDFMPYEITDTKHPDRDTDIDLAIEGSLWYRRPYKVHKSVGVNDATVVCPTSFGKKCPICEYRAKRAKEGADKDELATMNAKKRNLYCVIPLDSKKHDVEPHIFDMSDFLFQELLTKELKENNEYEVFPDLTEGLTLKIRFEPGSMKTTKPYPQASRIDFIERNEPYDESILEKIPNLDEVLIVLSYEEISNKFFETDDEPVNEGKIVEENEPVRERKTVTASTKRDPDDDIPGFKKEKASKQVEKETPIKKEATLSANGFTWEDLENMSQSRLEKLIVGYDLDVDAGDYEDDVTALRKAIAEAMEIDVPKPKVEKPAAKATKPVAKKSDSDCPTGHEYGKDTGKHEDCDDCDLYNECLEAKRKNK